MNNTFEDTIGTSPESGIDLEPWSANQIVTNVTISGNTCNDNNGVGIESGDWFGKVSGNTITGNTCNGNTKNGIDLIAVTGFTVSDNIAQSNGNYGIILYGCSHIDVLDNKVSDNGYNGIHLTEVWDQSAITHDCTVQNNTSHGNARYGIELTGGSTHNTVTGNNIWGNGRQPIYTDGTPNNTIAGNSCLD